MTEAGDTIAADAGDSSASANEEGALLVEQELERLAGMADPALRRLIRHELCREDVGPSGRKFAVMVNTFDWDDGDLEIELLVHVFERDEWRKLDVVRKLALEGGTRTVY